MSNDQDEFMKALKENIDNGLIKIHFTLNGKDGGPAGESVWATPVSKKYAKIGNIPFFVDEVSIDDIVEFQPNDESHVKEFVRLISSGSKKYHLTYQLGKDTDETLEHFVKVREYFNDHSCKVEGAAPGFCVVAVPVEMSEKKAHKMLKSTPFLTDFG